MQKIVHSVDYSPVLAEIKASAHDGKPHEEAKTLADLIKKDTAYGDTKGPIAVSRFIREIMADGIPETRKLTIQGDPVAYTYYANIRRLCKGILLGKVKVVAHASVKGIKRLIQAVAKVKSVADLEKLDAAVKARIEALKA